MHGKGLCPWATFCFFCRRVPYPTMNCGTPVSLAVDVVNGTCADIFASGGRDGSLMLWDVRNAGVSHNQGVLPTATERFRKPACLLHGDCNDEGPENGSSWWSYGHRNLLQACQGDTERTQHRGCCFVQAEGEACIHVSGMCSLGDKAAMSVCTFIHLK
jgi:hypothetical protein